MYEMNSMNPSCIRGIQARDGGVQLGAQQPTGDRRRRLLEKKEKWGKRGKLDSGERPRSGQVRVEESSNLTRKTPRR